MHKKNFKKCDKYDSIFVRTVSGLNSDNEISVTDDTDRQPQTARK